MPPRIRLQSKQLRTAERVQHVCLQCRHASIVSATTPAPLNEHMSHVPPPIVRHAAVQPPSYKPAEFRKSQLHRQYQSLLRSSQLMVIFQHNNLKSTEWMGIRRELATAMKRVDEELAKNGNQDFIGDNTKMQVVQTGIFASALKVVEFWDPSAASAIVAQGQDGPIRAASNAEEARVREHEMALSVHGLSQKAHDVAASRSKKLKHGLEPLLSGPLAILTLPVVSPQHLKAALSILSPSKDFPAPKRKTNPSYHEPAVANGLQKLLLLGARIEGRVFDVDGAKWVGGIDGGLDGLRGQLVAILQGIGASITTSLEGASRSVYLTMEGRRTMLEEEEKSGDAKKEEIA